MKQRVVPVFRLKQLKLSVIKTTYMKKQQLFKKEEKTVLGLKSYRGFTCWTAVKRKICLSVKWQQTQMAQAFTDFL